MKIITQGSNNRDLFWHAILFYIEKALELSYTSNSDLRFEM